jgi:hypothetical protein
MTKKPKQPLKGVSATGITVDEMPLGSFAEMQAKSNELLVKSLSIPAEMIVTVEPGNSLLIAAAKEQWQKAMMNAGPWSPLHESDSLVVKELAPYTTKPIPKGTPVFTLFKSLEHSPLVKADSGTPDYGKVDGMKIIAIGPKGGKIVGYDIHHDPIYAGTPKAKKLNAVKKAVNSGPSTPANHPDVHTLGKEWLEALGIQPLTHTTTACTISAKDAGPLHSEYGITVHTISSGVYAIKWADVVAHMGHPLVPHPSKLAIAAHNLASGVPSNHVFPESTFNTLKITVADLGGTHHPAKAEDKSGNEFVWKTNKNLGSHAIIASWAEEVFSRVAKLVAVEPDNYAKAEMGTLAGVEGCLLEFKDNKSTIGGGPKGANVPEGALKKYAKQLAQAHVLDWLMANHDAHGGNFLITPDEKGLIPVDKGQAFKFIGDDMLDVGYHPNEHEPVYNKLWKLVQSQKLAPAVVDEIVAAVKAQVQHVSDNLSLEQYQAIVWPYLEAGEGQGKWTASEQWPAIKKRYQNLSKDFEKFLSGITGKSIMFNVAPPALSIVEKVASVPVDIEKQKWVVPAPSGPLPEYDAGLLQPGDELVFAASFDALPPGSIIHVGHGLASTPYTKGVDGKWSFVGPGVDSKYIEDTWGTKGLVKIAYIASAPKKPKAVTPTFDLSAVPASDKQALDPKFFYEGFLSSVDVGTTVVLPGEHYTKEKDLWVDAEGDPVSSKTFATYLKHEATGGVQAIFITSAAAAKAKTAAPTAAVPEATAPGVKLAVQQMPGWPQSKGKSGATTTVHHPGTSPAPGVKWDAKYPGPGFKADAEYKGQKFTYEFGVLNGGPLVTVTFPDGTVKTTDNFAEAGDWVQLLEHGAPLTITSSMKKFGFFLDDSGTPQAFNKNNFDAAKAFKSKVTGKPLKGVSYTLTKLLKLDEFDFAGAGSMQAKAELPDSAKTVEQLESAHEIAPEQPKITAHAVLAALKGQVVTNKSDLPFAIQAALNEVPTGALPAGWDLPIAPGTVFVADEPTVDGGLFIFMAKHAPDVGAVLQSWYLKPDGTWDGPSTGHTHSGGYSAHTVKKAGIAELAAAKAAMDEAKKHTFEKLFLDTVAKQSAPVTITPDEQSPVLTQPVPVSTAEIVPEDVEDPLKPLVIGTVADHGSGFEDDLLTSSKGVLAKMKALAAKNPPKKDWHAPNGEVGYAKLPGNLHLVWVPDDEGETFMRVFGPSKVEPDKIGLITSVIDPAKTETPTTLATAVENHLHMVGININPVLVENVFNAASTNFGPAEDPFVPAWVKQSLKVEADFAALPVGTVVNVHDTDGDDLGPYTKQGDNKWQHASADYFTVTDQHLANDVKNGLKLTTITQPTPAPAHVQVLSQASPVVMTQEPELFVGPSLVPAFKAMLANTIPDDVFNKKAVKIEQGYLASAPAQDTQYEVLALSNGTSTSFILVDENTKAMIGIADAEPLAKNYPSTDLAAITAGALVANAGPSITAANAKQVGAAIATAVQHILSHAGGVAPPVQNAVEPTGAVPESEAKKITTAKMPADKVITTKLEPHLKESGVLSGKALIAVKPSNGGDTMLSVTIKSGNLAAGKTKHEVAAELHKFLSKYGIIAKKIGASTFSDGAYAYLHPSQVEKDITVEIPLEEAVNIAPAPPPTGFDGKTLKEAWGFLPLNEPLWFEAPSGKKHKFVVSAEMGKKPQLAIEGGAPPPEDFYKVYSHPNAWKPGEFGATFEDIPVGSEFILFKSVPGGSPVKVFAKKVDFDKVVTDTNAAPFKLPKGFDTFAPHNFVTAADLDSAPTGAKLVMAGPSANVECTKGFDGWFLKSDMGGSHDSPIAVANILAIATGLHTDGKNPGNALQAHKLILPEAQPAKQAELVATFKQGSKITAKALVEKAAEIPKNGYFTVLSADGAKKFVAGNSYDKGKWNVYVKKAAPHMPSGWSWSYDGTEHIPEGEYTIIEGGIVEKATPLLIPGKISKTQKKEDKVDVMNALPVGTQITHDSGTWTLLHHTAIGDGSNTSALWQHDDGETVLSSYALAHYKTKFGGPITPPNGVAGVQAKAKSVAKAKSDIASNVSKAQAYKPTPAKPADPELAAKAKAWGEWLKVHPAVTDDKTLIALGKAQADLKLDDAFVFQGVAGQILLGVNGGGDLAVKDALLPAITGDMQTPVGKMLIVDAKQLQNLYPSKTVEGINEHSGKSFPEGTTFTTQQVKTSKKEALEALAPGVYVKPHNTDTTLDVVKFPTGTNTLEAANKALAEVGISAKAGTGNVNHVASVPKGALDGVHKTETITTPVIPETPTWKQAGVKNAPVVGPQPKWQPQQANKGDLSAMESIKPGYAGHFIRCGDPAYLADCRLRVKKIKSDFGEILYEVSGTAPCFGADNLTAQAAAAGAKKTPTTIRITSALAGHYDEETGTVVAKSGTAAHDAMVSTISGGGEAALFTGTGQHGYAAGSNVYAGDFRITVPAKDVADLEAKIAEGLTAIGLDPAKILADHASDDGLERRWKKQRMLRSTLGGKGLVTTAKANKAVIEATKSEKKLDEKLADAIGSGWQGVLDTAQVVTGSAGEPTVKWSSLNANVSGLPTKSNIGHVLHVSSGIDSFQLAMVHLFAGFQSSRRFGHLTGTGAEGASAGSDEKTCGAVGAFLRVATNDIDSFSSCGSGAPVRIVYSKDVLEHTMGHFINGDECGDPGSGKAYSNIQVSNENNEIVIHDYVPMEYAVAFACANEETRKSGLMQWKKKRPGETHINGIPIEDFFVNVGKTGNDSGHIKAVQSKCKGLKMKIGV